MGLFESVGLYTNVNKKFGMVCQIWYIVNGYLEVEYMKFMRVVGQAH